MTTAVASLAPDFRGQSPVLGDLVRVEVLLDERIDNGHWRVKSEGNKPWVSSGSLTLNALKVTEMQADGNSTTKLSLTGLVHAPGMLTVGPMQLESDSGKVVDVASTPLGVTVAAAEKVDQKTPWMLPPISFGGWNYPVIGGIAVFVLVILGYLFWKLFRRFTRKFQRKLNHKEQALAELQDLQKFSGGRQGITQAEWKKFSFALASTIRRYSDRNFEMHTADLTDREFLATLAGKDAEKAQVAAITKILETIDAVRYGRRDLDTAVVPELLKSAEGFVNATFHSEEEELEAAKAKKKGKKRDA